MQAKKAEGQRLGALEFGVLGLEWDEGREVTQGWLEGQAEELGFIT